MKQKQVDIKSLRLLCEASRSNQEVATALGISANCVRDLCIRYGVESPWLRKKRLSKEKKTGKVVGSGLPEPRFEGHGTSHLSHTPTLKETAARIALQPPLIHIDPSAYSPPPPPDIVAMYREKHYDTVGIPRYKEVLMADEQIATPATVGEPIAVWHDEKYEPVLFPNEAPNPEEFLPNFNRSRAKWKIGYAIGVNMRGCVTNVSFSRTDLPVGRSNLKLTLGIDQVLIMDKEHYDAAISLIGQSFDSRKELTDEIVKVRKEMVEDEFKQ